MTGSNFEADDLFKLMLQAPLTAAVVDLFVQTNFFDELANKLNTSQIGATMLFIIALGAILIWRW